MWGRFLLDNMFSFYLVISSSRFSADIRSQLENDFVHSLQAEVSHQQKFHHNYASAVDFLRHSISVFVFWS